jgi:hypothetical protein
MKNTTIYTVELKFLEISKFGIENLTINYLLVSEFDCLQSGLSQSNTYAIIVAVRLTNLEQHHDTFDVQYLELITTG